MMVTIGRRITNTNNWDRQMNADPRLFCLFGLFSLSLLLLLLSTFFFFSLSSSLFLSFSLLQVSVRSFCPSVFLSFIDLSTLFP